MAQGINLPVRRMRLWAIAAASGQVLFVATWLLAATWQGDRYSPLAHSISDMYADGAPAGALMIVILVVCGVSVIGFALFSLWPALRGTGWTAGAGSTLLALSIFGLGDLLSPFERLACRLADPGCTPAAQIATPGGVLDTTLSTLGVVLLVVAALLLASAMKRDPGWRSWVGPTRLFAVV